MDQIYCYMDREMILSNLFSLLRQICLPQFSFSVQPAFTLILSQVTPVSDTKPDSREPGKAEELAPCSRAGSKVSVDFVITAVRILSCMDHWSEPVWPFIHSLAEMPSTCLHLTYILRITYQTRYRDSLIVNISISKFFS